MPLSQQQRRFTLNCFQQIDQAIVRCTVMESNNAHKHY